MLEEKQQVPEELQDVNSEAKGATPEEPQKPVGEETVPETAVVPDLTADAKILAEGVQDEGNEPEQEKEPLKEERTKEENVVPQKRFDEVYGKTKSLEREVRLLKEKSSVTTPAYEIGKGDVKEILQLSPQQSEALEEWNDRDPMSAQAWVNDQTQQMRRQAENFSYEVTTNKEVLQEKHPDMYKFNPATGRNDEFDETSAKGRIFEKIARENPYLQNSPTGPKVAMILLEEELRKTGGVKVKVNKNTAFEKGREAEALRQRNFSQTAIVKNASAPKAAAKVQLSPAQKRVAQMGGSTEEEYIANMRPTLTSQVK